MYETSAEVAEGAPAEKVAAETPTEKVAVAPHVKWIICFIVWIIRIVDLKSSFEVIET